MSVSENRKITTIFNICFACRFCKDIRTKDRNKIAINYLCMHPDLIKTKVDNETMVVRDIERVDTIPEWCPLPPETVIDYTKNFHVVVK